MPWNMPEAKEPNVLSLLVSVGELGLSFMPVKMTHSSEEQVSIQVFIHSANSSVVKWEKTKSL